MLLWDTAWQIAAKADEAAMIDYVDRLAAARGNAGQSVTGFWFSVVNINQDIATPNGVGETFGSFGSPNPVYLDHIERLIELAYDRGLRVGIVLGWDGPLQFSVESGQLSLENAYAYGNRLQLFDLHDDPQELTDLADLPGYATTREELVRTLLGELYGNDSDWSDNATLIGVPADQPDGTPDRSLSLQRGSHWPIPPQS